MPQIYRDIELNSVWEGSGNVAALDVLARAAKEPEGLPAFLAECEEAAGADARLDDHLSRVREGMAALGGPDTQWLARRAVEDLGRGAPGEPASAARTARGRGRLLRRRGSGAAAGRSARCRRASTRRRSSTGRSRCRRARVEQLSTLTYEVDGPDRADHARPPRARQRDHARDAARARRVRRARRPRPRRPRDRARRERQGLLRRLRPRGERRGVDGRGSARPPPRPARRSTPPSRRRTTTPPAPGTRWSTTR